jgi:hypothetical protein
MTAGVTPATGVLPGARVTTLLQVPDFGRRRLVVIVLTVEVFIGALTSSSISTPFETGNSDGVELAAKRRILSPPERANAAMLGVAYHRHHLAPAVRRFIKTVSLLTAGSERLRHTATAWWMGLRCL